MKNLQNFGVQELSAKEIKEIEGGFIWPILEAITVVLAIGAAIDYIAGEVIKGWDNPK
tara:strand:+ start:232 stop:405 length:174 start_codon:yes stop_codon:yes gene_type:complete